MILSPTQQCSPSSNQTLAQLIYSAQCFGNVEPIEYMVPYPNLRALAVGQCIKFSNNILYKDIGITNGAFLKSINKTANWLIKNRIIKNDRVFVTNIPSPMMEILSYAIWSIGAVLVIANVTLISFAITEKIAGIIFIGILFPVIILLLLYRANKHMLPIVYTALII